jgi:hypothetical protein
MHHTRTIWREVARCPQVSNCLPHVRTKLGTVLEDFTLSLVCVHTFCKAELEEEQNTMNGHKKACTVRTALAKSDHSFLTIVEDMLPIARGSHKVLNACLTQTLLEQTK